jgi:GxxExxY protein
MEMAVSEQYTQLTEQIIGAAMRVHTQIGPGLLESAYEACLAFELTSSGLAVERQKPLPVVYRDVQLDCGYRLDLVIQDAIVVEIKSVDALIPIHTAQILSYLKLSGYHGGLLINFNVFHLRSGIKRIVHDI